MAHPGLLYGAQIGFILSNKVIYALLFSSLGIGRFCGRILGRVLTNPVCDFTLSLHRRSRSGASSDPLLGQVSVRVFYLIRREGTSGTGNYARHRIRPRPPWGQGWRKGGCMKRENLSCVDCPGFHPIRIRLFQKFSGKLDFRPEKYGRMNFRPELFWFFQVSNRKKLGRKTFKPNFFAIFNFRAKNFPAKKISRPKKVRVLGHIRRVNISGFTMVIWEAC